MDKRWYIKIWTERKYLDFWSLNHILAGCMLASIFIFFNISFLTSIIISFLILLAWEFFEFFAGIHETMENKILDVIIGLLGFFITYYLMNNNIFNNLTLFLIIFFPFLILETWGWLAYEKLHQNNEKIKI